MKARLLAALAAAACLSASCGEREPGGRPDGSGAKPAPPREAAPAPVPSVDSVEPVRRPVGAGRFYPGSERELRLQVESLLRAATRVEPPGRAPSPVRAVTAPHAGYVFSGSVAAAAIKQINWPAVKTVVIIGGHSKPLDGASVYPRGSYRTPLGNAVVDSGLARDIIACSKRVRYEKWAHERDHALEVLVPFIQVAAPAAKIVPVHFWSEKPEVIEEVAIAIARGVIPRLEPAGGSPAVVIVNSTDLSHYPDYETARAADGTYLKAVESLDPRKILAAELSLRDKHRAAGLQCAACGTPGVALTASVARMLGVSRAKAVMYLNSGDNERYGDKRKVVGYGAVAYYGRGEIAKLSPPPAPAGAASRKGGEMSISVEGRKMLLRIARESIAAAFDRKPAPKYDVAKELQVPAGVFVTLKKGERLRGCIGIFEADKPVWQQVSEYARNSAFHDPRFGPLRKEELDDVWIEISVLSKPEPIDDPLNIEIGKHGIWIIGADGYHRGTYLPQVATEHNMTKEQFLSDCCSRKARLAADAWKDPKKAKVLVYTAEVFSERDVEGKKH